MVDMFIGEYQHHLDEKGRLAVPAKFRSQLSDGAIVTRGVECCLFLYPKTEWKKLADKLIGLPISQAKSRAFARLMIAGAFEVKPDSQGRINLPESLIKYAQLKKKAILAGLYNRVEIWDEDSWKKIQEQAEKDSEKIAESMAELGV